MTAERGAEDRHHLPVSTAVLTAGELEQRPAATLADAVQMLPGFQVLSSDASGAPTASIARGFFGGGEAEYVKVLLDGVPLGDAESGAVDWRRVPAIAIGRVEALRGPSSAMYGDTALGGVVQLFTVTPSARTGRLSLTAGSFGSAMAGGEYAQPLGTITLRALGSYNHSDGSRLHSKLREGFTAMSAQHGATPQWTARMVFTHLDRDEPGALSDAQLATDRRASDPAYRFDGDSSWRGYGAVRYASATGPVTYSILGHAGTRSSTRTRTLLLAPGVGDRANRDLATNSAGASFENSASTSWGGVAGQLRFGFDVSLDVLDTSYRAVSNNGEIRSVIGSLEARRVQIAGYGAQSLVVGPASFFGGVRWDGLGDRAGESTRVSHAAWSPRAGAVLSAGRGVAVFANVSRAFKAATLDQLFDPRPFPDFRGGIMLLSSPLLRPQRAVNVEGGIRQVSDRYRWEAVVYRMRMRDEIDFDPATFTYGNIGRSTHDGVEVDASLIQGAAVTVAGNYAWTRVAPGAGGTEGHQLKNIPRHVIRPHVTVTLPAQATIHVRYTRTAGAYADDDNQVPLGPRSSIDVRATKRFRRLITRIDLLNLTNDQYEEMGYVLADFRGGQVPFYYPASGFTARASVELTF